MKRWCRELEEKVPGVSISQTMIGDGSIRRPTRLRERFVRVREVLKSKVGRRQKCNRHILCWHFPDGAN